MSFVSKIEAVFATGSLKWNCAINENDRVIDIVFVMKFCEKLICYNVCSCRFKLCMWKIVRVSVDSSVQPIVFIVELNHSLVNRNVIRAPTSFWL